MRTTHCGSARLCLGIILGLVFSVGAVGAQTLSVEYIEGEAAQKKGATWTNLSVGDLVQPDGSVRLGPHALVQLKAPGAAITLSQPGIYGMTNVLAARASLGRTGAGKAVAVAISRLFVASTRIESSAGGVRAEQFAETDFSDWVETDSDVPLEEGKDFLSSGEYEKAIARFEEAVRAAMTDQASEARFYLASAYSLTGKTREALKQIDGLQPTGSEGWAPDFVLLKAKLLEDTFAFAPAVQLLFQNGETLAADPERGQTYFFLLALGYRGTGDTGREKLCLTKVVSLDPVSDLGESAAQLLEDL